jgi:chorismate mutase/prephenate dehydratase
MSSPSPQPAPAPPDLTSRRLAALRAELDRIDDALHDGLMRRAELVAQVGALGAKGRVPLRPGREASIIRRLVARNHGALDPATVTRIWRELLAGSTAQQRPLLVAVSDERLIPLAREHFGALTPVRVRPGPAEALEDVRDGRTTVAVLPLPTEGVWWTALLSGQQPRAHVVARLPFWARRSEHVPVTHCVVLSAAAPDPSGDDRSLIGFELAGDFSHAQLGQALASAGLAVGAVVVVRVEGMCFGLADVAGFLEDGDARLLALDIPRPAVVLGAYATPVGASA